MYTFALSVVLCSLLAIWASISFPISSPNKETSQHTRILTSLYLRAFFFPWKSFPWATFLSHMKAYNCSSLRNIQISKSLSKPFEISWFLFQSLQLCPIHRGIYSCHTISCLVQWAVQYLPVGTRTTWRLCKLSLHWRERTWQQARPLRQISNLCVPAVWNRHFGEFDTEIRKSQRVWISEHFWEKNNYQPSCEKGKVSHGTDFRGKTTKTTTIALTRVQKCRNLSVLPCLFLREIGKEKEAQIANKQQRTTDGAKVRLFPLMLTY